MAIQRQAVHADVPSIAGPASAAVAAHGTSSSTADAAAIIRGRHSRASRRRSWIRLCLPALRLPWTGALHVVSGQRRCTDGMCPLQYPQPMMPGMAPPPPGAYMPAPPPFMQPMPYPMPPNAMYPAGPMGQMPPPQAYMQQAPPPGAYPVPPNGAGPRPSMPPTPIPSHAHPYYQQSPQMQHAVPYPMMMPPPGPQPHPYDGSQAPPVPMGGVGHA
ncbi:uncharacterized protein LAESUDRAFT_526852 [Laetiporus sulphureus 93-53]|uniref:Uncharacterized protein n=1 Tax=Laetiporus sulphureus 93-53 TaxID=1314785 RepID=A0A165BD74_9APHY|nr:uncharacterized protein LAESUDRAFT_526852 [Laetiporus sulphureus 93-53]KZT00785.1 hypothetical protein LAESUDRAFT_526852 [Laetiporus sulphureus 93-53]